MMTAAPVIDMDALPRTSSLAAYVGSDQSTLVSETGRTLDTTSGWKVK